MACLSLLSGVHPLPLLLLITLLGPVALVRGVTFRVVNKCPFPVWPAAAPNAGHPVLAGGGFLLPPGQSRRVSAPPTWNGRFWGRTGCNFTSTATNHHGNAAASCLTGDCGGRLACNGTAGAPPATLVEVDLHEDQSKGSSYDVSLVDGYNLPVAVWTKPPTPGGGGGVQERVRGVRDGRVLLPRRARHGGDVPRQRVLAGVPGRVPGVRQLPVRHGGGEVLRGGVRAHILSVQMGRGGRSCGPGLTDMM
jgi:hypothetical protein